ncbi:MAG: ABC transporter substrate-binding protein [Smithellaceae bacterium]|nr:ABC transporter substrate-binding protein [Smithellaceae bacterium]
MNRMSGRFLVSVLAVIVVTIYIGSVMAQSGEIKIGVIGPMAFTPGEHMWYGAKLAEAEINGRGGISVGTKKYTVKVIKIDSNEEQSVPDAANAMERAVTYDKVDFLIGGFRTEAVFAMQDVAMDYKKIFIGIGAAHPELCARVASKYDRYKYWFRVTPLNSNYLGQIIFILVGMVGDVVTRELGIAEPKVAVIAEKAVWADPVVEAAKTVLPGMGMELVGVWRPSFKATDVTAELTAIRGSGAHIIFTAFAGAVGIVYAKQWGELKIPAASVGINAEAQKAGFWKATGGLGNYELTANALARVKITPKTIPFHDKFTKNYGDFPHYTAVGAYDGINLLIGALERAKVLDSDRVVTEMEKSDFTGVAGRLVFSKDHDVTWGPGHVTSVGTQWQNGKLQCVWPVPEYSWQGVKYEGSTNYKLPPALVEKWKKKR